MKLLNVIKIYDRISMHAEEAIWVEYRLEIFDTLPNHKGRLTYMESNVIPRRLEPQDILDLYNDNLFTCFYCQSPQILALHRPVLRGARALIRPEFSTGANNYRFG
jgi:hypothetical protein